MSWKALLVPLFLLEQTAAAEPWKPLLESGFKAIEFKKLPPTVYTLEAGVFTAKVRSSSSAWLLPRSTAMKVKKVSFAWKHEGRPRVEGVESEKSKAGDDSLLKVGLVLAGPAPTIPFFAPAWIKAVRDILTLPSDRMLYLVVGAQHAPGQRWPSPYSDSIQQESLASTPGKDAWQLASYEAAKPEDVVGLWLMADGDNTAASFSVEMKDLLIE